MRKCHRCEAEMQEGFSILASGVLFGGIEITSGTGLFAKWSGKPKAAMCPKCGEVSLYIENINDIPKSEESINYDNGFPKW